jgi:hypothetical protein
LVELVVVGITFKMVDGMLPVGGEYVLVLASEPLVNLVKVSDI